MMFEVVLYTRPGCCLCDRAVALLQNLRGEYSFSLQHINIDEVPELAARWRCHIPVVTIDGENRVALRITEQRLRRAFHRAHRKRAM
jgi:glutaredoxin